MSVNLVFQPRRTLAKRTSVSSIQNMEVSSVTEGQGEAGSTAARVGNELKPCRSNELLGGVHQEVLP